MSYLGFYGVFALSVLPIFLLEFFLLIKFDFFFFKNGKLFINLIKIFYLNDYPVNFSLYLDTISYSFILLTVTIACFVYLYTFSYFRYEPNIERLMIFINLFVISMSILVTSGNLIMIFLGWELIGLTSFLLINF